MPRESCEPPHLHPEWRAGPPNELARVRVRAQHPGINLLQITSLEAVIRKLCAWAAGRGRGDAPPRRAICPGSH